MTLKYAGPKLLFSQSGIHFDTKKEDKYVYLNIAIQLCEALSHEHAPNHVYVYDVTTKHLSDREINAHLSKGFAQKESLWKEAELAAFLYIEHEQQRAQIQCTQKETLEAWLANIDLMKEYLLQRHFNKYIYYALIYKLGSLVAHYRISEIHTPMFHKFVHVLHSLQGALKESKRSLQSEISFYKKEDALMAKLLIRT